MYCETKVVTNNKKKGTTKGGELKEILGVNAIPLIKQT